MALYKNNTGEVTKVGYTCKQDSKDPQAIVYANAGDTNIIGIITQAVPRFAKCEVVATGITKVFCYEMVVKGSTIRAQKVGDNISRGTCKAAVTSDRPYFIIGMALESGKGLIRVDLNLSSGESASNYVPYSGAIEDVRLGTKGIEANDAIIGTSISNVTIDGNGDMSFIGNDAGLPYGACYGNEIGWSQAAAQNTWYNISDTDMADGELHHVTHDGSGKLTITKAGRYLISYSWAGGVSTNNTHVQIGIEVSGSGSAVASGMTHFESDKANSHNTASGTTILDLAVNATVEISVRTTDAGNPTIDTDHINLTILMIGGT